MGNGRPGVTRQRASSSTALRCQPLARSIPYFRRQYSSPSPAGKNSPNPRFRVRATWIRSIFDDMLLARVHPHTPIDLLRLAKSTRGKWHVDLIKHRIGRDAVSVALSGDILQPLPAPRINDSQNRASGHVSCPQVIAVIAWVVPSLVNSA